MFVLSSFPFQHQVMCSCESPREYTNKTQGYLLVTLPLLLSLPAYSSRGLLSPHVDPCILPLALSFPSASGLAQTPVRIRYHLSDSHCSSLVLLSGVMECMENSLQSRGDGHIKSPGLPESGIARPSRDWAHVCPKHSVTVLTSAPPSLTEKSPLHLWPACPDLSK